MSNIFPVGFFFCIPVLISAAEKYVCGEKKTVNKPYGQVELRVDCELSPGQIWAAEFKGDLVHGFSQSLDSASGRKIDSSFYVNGERNGTSLVWDSLGNVISRSTYKNGHYIGKRESFFAPGRAALIKHYNTEGEEEGPWEEWWKNGNKKAKYIARGGRIVSGKEYYQSGKPRAFYQTKYEPENLNVLKKKFIQAQAWAPNGKSTGRIVAGKGEWILFPDGSDTTNHTVFREVYKDSVMVEGKKLDSAAIAKWLRS